jgi:hypothetical protein
LIDTADIRRFIADAMTAFHFLSPPAPADAILRGARALIRRCAQQSAVLLPTKRRWRDGAMPVERDISPASFLA